MIVATAGHVDHGKTSLVKALTGVDADRLPEEKRRGMTIDLGFAYMEAGSAGRIAFVDVPGHSRFVHNMLSGYASIDFVLLAVAADDGPMPQTHEHLGILDLLGISKGALVVTKIDRVSPARLAEVQTELAVVLAATSLASVPTFSVSTADGTGVEELKRYLLRAAQGLPARTAAGAFRLPVDRCFTVQGAGLVVTGTVVSGEIAVGAHVRTRLGATPFRVRGIHAQNAKADSARAGQRCALNLASADSTHAGPVARGDWIVGGDAPSPTRRIDVAFRTAAGESLEHWMPVHLHLGSADVTGRAAVLESSGIPAGQSGLVQFVLQHPIGAWSGDAVIARDQSARRTIGGGRVVDVFPPARGRARPERLAFLRAMSNSDHAGALRALLDASGDGVDLNRFASARNLTVEEAAGLFSAAPMHMVAGSRGSMGYSERRWLELRSTALDLLAAWHRRAPDSPGPVAGRIFSETQTRLSREAAEAIVAELAREGTVLRRGTAVQLPSHRVTLGPADAALWKKVWPILVRSGTRPPTVRDIAKAVGESSSRIESLLVRATQRGELVRLSDIRFYRPEDLARLAAVAEKLAKESSDGLLSVGPFRDRTGIGRNLTIEVLEFFDRVGFTKRMNDARAVLKSADAWHETEEAGHRPHA